MKTVFRLMLIAFTTIIVFCGCNEKEIKRPNFLFVLVDDQSAYDLKLYEASSILETPNIDRLAAEGMVFDGARHMGSMNGAVCTPSRHMIMSGRTVWHLPHSAGYKKRILPDSLELQTMGAVFNRAGYNTMRTCKKGNSYQLANEQFTVVHDATKRGGTEETGSAWHAKQVLNYLNKREENQENDPFFIYFGFSHPHDVRDGTPELLAKYGSTNHKDQNSLPPANPKQPQVPANYLPSHPFFHGHVKLRDEERVPGVWKNRDVQTIRNEQGRKFALSEHIEFQMGQVLDKLESMGELDNTYIVYTADHGIAIGRHGLMGKQNLYEHCWKVPFIVKGPGIEAGKRVQGNVYLLDLLPTFCDLAGVEIPETVMGKSFKPVLTGEKETIRDVMYGVYCGGTKPGMRSVQKGDWKLIKYDLMNGSIRETQLFNLAKNPYEYLPEHGKTGEMETDLAENPKYANKLAEMEALLLEQMIKHDDPYRFWDQPEKKNNN